MGTARRKRVMRSSTYQKTREHLLLAIMRMSEPPGTVDRVVHAEGTNA